MNFVVISVSKYAYATKRRIHLRTFLIDAKITPKRTAYKFDRATGRELVRRGWTTGYNHRIEAYTTDGGAMWINGTTTE